MFSFIRKWLQWGFLPIALIKYQNGIQSNRKMSQRRENESDSQTIYVSLGRGKNCIKSSDFLFFFCIWFVFSHAYNTYFMWFPCFLIVSVWVRRPKHGVNVNVIRRKIQKIKSSTNKQKREEKSVVYLEAILSATRAQTHGKYSVAIVFRYQRWVFSRCRLPSFIVFCYFCGVAGIVHWRTHE